MLEIVVAIYSIVAFILFILSIWDDGFPAAVLCAVAWPFWGALALVIWIAYLTRNLGKDRP